MSTCDETDAGKLIDKSDLSGCRQNTNDASGAKHHHPVDQSGAVSPMHNAVYSHPYCVFKRGSYPSRAAGSVRFVLSLSL